jgi:hypothetical protein
MSTAKKTAKGTSKSKPTKPATTMKARELSYGVHKEGSRKGKVHELFNKEGPEAAWVLGLKLKLKENTLRSWFAAWKRLQGNSKDGVKTNSSTPPAIKPDDLSATTETANL